MVNFSYICAHPLVCFNRVIITLHNKFLVFFKAFDHNINMSLLYQEALVKTCICCIVFVSKYSIAREEILSFSIYLMLQIIL